MAKKVESYIAARQKERDERIRSDLTALNKVMRALLRLPESARPRVLRFLHDEYVEDE